MTPMIHRCPRPLARHPSGARHQTRHRLSSLTPVETAAAAPPAADPPTADPAAASITDSIGATVTDSAGAGATEPASTPEAGATNGVQTEPPAISVETVIPPSHAPVAIANPL
ncbi:hypothetical protein OF83DRAFT_1176843 [Amylostereum chailletii]|nr:hypothetical protein OF83DRAFT_1176843 [Amylostereum chailletii]